MLQALSHIDGFRIPTWQLSSVVSLALALLSLGPETGRFGRGPAGPIIEVALLVGSASQRQEWVGV